MCAFIVASVSTIGKLTVLAQGVEGGARVLLHGISYVSQ